MQALPTYRPRPSLADHLLNGVALLLLLTDAVMIIGLFQYDFERYLDVKTSWIKGEGDLRAMEILQFTWEEQILPIAIVVILSYFVGIGIHLPRMVQKPGDLNEGLFWSEVCICLLMFVLIWPRFLDHCCG